ncbi:MAG: ferrous iron transport protein A [Deltaproteobacteria bacterium]|jgi:Fe2+ transport system protein FeoA|nr:ferrous iron transport protein A [Deltaproteobacteria bacterium]MBT4087764.1 ferrous iron transport protein A [Deltaproteobacteria bacterium]MBT4262598.1 ferrous iron transport protein A [Deltaproteobacteria bacterium]MBT4640600.1 ferrous iron transport protein A [Deltaproteobacteria bacterium]MBT6500774.1 ferrous iron transport protein A [Deltaproteobacteria bacterium]
MVPLNQLNEGDFGEIIEISKGCHRQCPENKGWKRRFFSDQNRMGQGRMAGLGLRIGKKIQLLQKRNQGPLLIKVGDSRIVVGREMAENIFIKIKNSVLS